MSGEELKILVVDDSKVMRHIITSFLAKMGYDNVLQASNVSTALQILAEDKPSLVISDYSMPGLTGLDLLRKMRSDSETKNLVFVMITAEAQLFEIMSAFRGGVDYYVIKPFTRDYFEYVLQRAITE
ncbi:MAG: response regulator [Pseudomonadota bacterium]